MPHLVTIPHDLSTIVDAFDPPQVRKPGWHVTDLYYAAQAIASSKLEAFVYQKLNVTWVDDSGMASWGRMWEGAVRGWVWNHSVDTHLDMEFSEEIEKDEIIANLDGRLSTYSKGVPIHTPSTNVAVVEMKATTTNDTNPLTKPNWICQTKAYCHMIGVNQVWFIVLHMPRRGAPEARVFKHIVTFEDWEIAENWQMLISTKEYLESRGIKLWKE